MNHCGRALHFVECFTCCISFQLQSSKFLCHSNSVANSNSNSGIERDAFLLFCPTLATKHTPINDKHVLVPVILFGLFKKVVQDLNMQLLTFKSRYPVHVFGVGKMFLKEVYCAHQGWINLIKCTVQTVLLLNLNAAFLKNLILTQDIWTAHVQVAGLTPPNLGLAINSPKYKLHLRLKVNNKLILQSGIVSSQVSKYKHQSVALCLTALTHCYINRILDLLHWDYRNVNLCDGSVSVV